MPTVEDTIEFIKQAHAGQVDKAGNPYWQHPVSVMRRLGSDATDQEKMVALLHDVLEDTLLSADDLHEMGYPAGVVDAVQLLSRPRGPERPTYMDWIRSIASSGNRIAIRVKIADNEDNSDPERIAALPPEGRDISNRYAQSLKILRAVR